MRVYYRRRVIYITHENDIVNVLARIQRRERLHEWGWNALGFLCLCLLVGVILYGAVFGA